MDKLNNNLDNQQQSNSFFTSQSNNTQPTNSNHASTNTNFSNANHITSTSQSQSQTTNTFSAQPNKTTSFSTQPSKTTTFSAQPSSTATFSTQTYATNTSSEKAKKPMSSNTKTFLLGFVGALLACIIALAGFALYNALSHDNFSANATEKASNTTLGATTSTPVIQTDENETLAEAVSEKCLKSVVSINVYSNSKSSSSISSSSTGAEELASLGSGVILSTDGYVVTNSHVVENSSALKVNTSEGEKSAKLVGEDSSSDIAVIKVDGVNNLSPIELGDSDAIKTGQWVMSIGSPFGLEQSVATGIVSATSRSQVVSSQEDGTTKVYPNLIQTDAAINPGNSGGALVSSKGQLIGINALITSSSGNYSGVGFAIPVNYAISLAKTIIEGGTPSHAQMGVSAQTVTPSNAKQNGLSVDKGAYVSVVASGSSADKAGIQKGDIIIKMNDTNIESSNDLVLATRTHNPGDTVSVTFVRGSDTQTVSVTLGSDEGKTQQSQSSKSKSNNGGGSSDMYDLWRYFFGQ